jgi:hypothetical protein
VVACRTKYMLAQTEHLDVRATSRATVRSTYDGPWEVAWMGPN